MPNQRETVDRVVKRLWDQGTDITAGRLLEILQKEGLLMVPRKAVEELHRALCGPGYLTRELQAISRIREDCPIKALNEALK